MEYTIKKGKLALTASEHGAELRSLTWEKKELIWEGKKEVWPRRAPICFPWCGKLAEGKGSFGGWQCKGPQHGFIRDLEHVLAAQEEDLLRFRLSWAGDESWPWAFSFETEHRLTQEGAITTCAVVNAGSQPMAMQLGFHPGFACPFLPGTAVEDYQVRFESGLVVPLTEHLFDNDSIQYQGVGAWARLHFGRSPYLLIVPYTAAQVQTLAATSNDWAVLVTSFSGKIDNHYPKHPILQFAQNQSVVFPQITVRNPLKNGIVVYTDGSKTGIGAYVANGKVVSKQYNENSPQVVECLVVLEVLKTFLEPLNIVSDSCYVVNAVNLLEVAGVIKPSSRVANIFQQIQLVLLSRRFPVYITHVRAHSGLPGPMALGNDLADKATKVVAAALSSPVEAARNFHNNFHVTAETLRSRFSLTRKEARDIVTQCQSCCEFLPVPHVGINPRGIRPLQVWQMDVTHVSSFGKLQYLHVSIDTCSGIMFASPLTGEKASHVIQHCLEAWSAWGKPKLLKTDNGPAYTSQKFQQFCRQMDVTHLTGLPYNPQGQGIVERAHRTLKAYLIKQKRGTFEETVPRAPRVSVSLALFTLNFLNIDAHGHTAAERHCSEPDRPNEMVKWKNVLDNKWYGPDPILIRSRGAICVFPQNEDNPFWIPERLTRKIQTDQGNTNVPRLGDVQGVNNKERAALGDNVDISTPNDGDV